MNAGKILGAVAVYAAITAALGLWLWLCHVVLGETWAAAIAGAAPFAVGYLIQTFWKNRGDDK